MTRAAQSREIAGVGAARRADRGLYATGAGPAARSTSRATGGRRARHLGVRGRADAQRGGPDRPLSRRTTGARRTARRSDRRRWRLDGRHADVSRCGGVTRPARAPTRRAAEAKRARRTPVGDHARARRGLVRTVHRCAGGRGPMAAARVSGNARVSLRTPGRRSSRSGAGHGQRGSACSSAATCSSAPAVTSSRRARTATTSASLGSAPRPAPTSGLPSACSTVAAAGGWCSSPRTQRWSSCACCSLPPRPTRSRDAGRRTGCRRWPTRRQYCASSKR